LVTMAIGIVARNSAMRIQTRLSKKYAYANERKDSDSMERMPLHASTTWSLWLGNSSTLPSRDTGIPIIPNATVANWLAIFCKGNVRLGKKTCEIRIIKGRRKSENAKDGRTAVPARVQITPITLIRNAVRAIKKSAPRKPSNIWQKPQKTSRTAGQQGLTGC